MDDMEPMLKKGLSTVKEKISELLKVHTSSSNTCLSACG